jgi:uncharacterized protein YbbC (DUF1343 family)
MRYAFVHHRTLNHAQLVGVVFSAESFIQLLTQHHMTLCLIGIESRYHLELLHQSCVNF